MTCRPHRLSACHRHPSQHITGFCASCLRERLQGMEASPAPPQEQPTRAGNNGDGRKWHPQLRRTKSCYRGDRLAASEPRRRSCEVRAKNTLSELFDVDDEGNGLQGRFDFEVGNAGFEIREEELDEVEERRVSEIVGDEGQTDKMEKEEDGLTMKEFIDLELQSRKSNAGRDLKEIAGSLWEATSTFTKRLRKWGRKHKLKKNREVGGDGSLMDLNLAKITARDLGEAQSKVTDHVSGRRSCDADPRLSADAGRISVDDSRLSFDEPRASWDGYLIGKSCHPRLMPLVSVMEDVKNTPICEIRGLGSVREECPLDFGWERRRRSLDSSISSLQQAISETDELKLLSNSKVSPAMTELLCGAKLLITEKELMEKQFGPAGDNGDLHSKDASDILVKPCDRGGSKKPQKWRGMLNLLGMVQKKNEGVGVEDDKETASEIADKPSGAPPLANGEIRLISHQIIRSSSVQCRDPGSLADLCSHFQSSQAKGISPKEKQDIMVLRKQSPKFSPQAFDDGLLRFDLTPSRSYRRRSKSRI